MADSHAETGVIAAKAGGAAPATGSDTSADLTPDAAKGEPGTADLAGDPPADAAKPDAKAKDSDAKKPKSDAKTKETTKKVVEATKNLVDKVLDETAKAETTVETTKIKMKRSHPHYAYHAGEVGELPTEKATALIADGFAEAVAATEPTL